MHYICDKQIGMLQKYASMIGVTVSSKEVFTELRRIVVADKRAPKFD